MLDLLNRPTSVLMLLALCSSVNAAQLPGTGIRFDPAITMSAVRDDNVFFREEDATADSSLIINPQLRMSSDLGIAGDSVNVDMDFRRESYSQESTLDNDEYRVSFDGIKMLTRHQHLALGVVADKSVLIRNAADSFGTPPDTLKERELTLGYEYKAGSIPVLLTLGRASYRYSPLGSAVDESDDLRDRDETLAQVEFGYAPTDARGLYLRLQRGDITGKSDLANVERRDGEFIEWRLGYRFRTDDLIDLEANLGVHNLTYDETSLAEVKEFVHLLRAEFALTPLTKLTFDSTNQFEMTRLAGSPGYLSLTNTLALQHDFGRRLRLEVYLTRGSDTFLDSEVEDMISEQGVSVHYFFARRLSVFATATQETRRRNRVALDSVDDSTIERAVVTAGVRYGM